MKIKQLTNEKLGETVFCAVHPSGLEIRVMPKKGYDSAYAVFGVKYGSIDTALQKESGEFETIPEGTAHFLEHKLFESEDLNAFERFAKTGASANAYTSFEKTAYLFKGSDKIEESLEILLDFVQNPYFTQETVEKEQGIIGQEIRMYQDLPDWQVMFNLLRALYEKHPVRIDIAGTQESIAEIDADLLYGLYKNFYNPANMVLCVVGAIEPEKVFDIVEKNIKETDGRKIERKFEKESAKPVKDYVEEKLSVACKQFLLGYKEDISGPLLSLEDELASQIMLEAIAGKSSPLYKKLLDEELIDLGFGTELFNGFGFSCVMMGGTSADPDKTVSILRSEIKRMQKEGIDPVAFERAKRKTYGRMVMGYNDIDDTANLMMNLYFNGYEPFAELEACKNITLEKAQERLAVLKEKSSAVSVISPIE
ncbi:MAG: insulinase family protein [Clostridia bacterium]|nr:insulinase family protein [Clostridia bacterium]MBR3780388.1 insulinase family protein [Clostridia bacterium]